MFIQNVFIHYKCRRFRWRNGETDERSRKGSSVFFCLFIGQFSIKKQSFGDTCLVVMLSGVSQEEGTFPSTNRSKQAAPDGGHRCNLSRFIISVMLAGGLQVTLFFTRADVLQTSLVSQRWTTGNRRAARFLEQLQALRFDVLIASACVLSQSRTHRKTRCVYGRPVTCPGVCDPPHG